MLELLQKIPKDYVPLLAAVVGAMLTPVVTAVACVVARFGLQSKVAEADYQLKQLELVQKALAIEAAFGHRLSPSNNTEILKAEYLRYVSRIAVAVEQHNAAGPSQDRVAFCVVAKSLALDRMDTDGPLLHVWGRCGAVRRDRLGDPLYGRLGSGFRDVVGLRHLPAYRCAELVLGVEELGPELRPAPIHGVGPVGARRLMQPVDRSCGK